MPIKTITTKYKIGKTTYLVTSAPCGKATDTIEQRLKRLIIKDVGRLE